MRRIGSKLKVRRCLNPAELQSVRFEYRVPKAVLEKPALHPPLIGAASQGPVRIETLDTAKHLNRETYRQNQAGDMQRGRGQSYRRSRGGRGSGGGRGGHTNDDSSRPSKPRPAYTSVPPIRAIHPGGGVSIVLKEDQQSGHRVKGIVADLLTRGDHPRGVKVRLRDGRVGRVQGLVSEAEGVEGEGIVGGPEAGLGRNGEGGANIARGGRRSGRMERDIREDDEYLYENRASTQDYGLFAALDEADKRHEQSRAGPSSELLTSAEVAVCPVCYKFEGDEASVAHHVEQHFAE